jgi:hypothetical protein
VVGKHSPDNCAQKKQEVEKFNIEQYKQWVDK